MVVTGEGQGNNSQCGGLCWEQGEVQAPGEVGTGEGADRDLLGSLGVLQSATWDPLPLLC